MSGIPSGSLRLALSPYHLTTRDPAAMAAFLLAERVITLLPVPPAGISREAVRAALRSSPPYGRLLESWRWAAELFEEGVISSVEFEHDPIERVREIHESVSAEGWVAIRPFMHDGPFDASADYLDELSMDMLKGGPDPGWSLPIIAGLDELAVESGWISVRAGQAAGPRAGKWRGSLAQLAESRIARPVCSLAVPVLVQAGAGVILLARQMLAEPLAGLTGALVSNTGDAGGGAGGAAVRSAARAYAEAFAGVLPTLKAAGQEEGYPVIDQLVRITMALLPAKAALMAASSATGRPGSTPASASREPVLRAMIIEPMVLRAS